MTQVQIRRSLLVHSLHLRQKLASMKLLYDWIHEIANNALQLMVQNYACDLPMLVPGYAEQ